MLEQKQVVLDFEGFKYKRNEFVLKELSVCCDFLDTIYLLPPINFNQLSTDEKKAHTWVTRNFHGIDWSEGEHNYHFHR